MVRVAVVVLVFFGFSSQAMNSRNELYGVALGIAASVKSVIEVFPGFLKKENLADQIKSLRKKISEARLTSDFDKIDELEEELRNFFELRISSESAKEEKTFSPAPVFVPGVKQSCGGKCHLTGQPLREPVISSDGYTYERQALIDWFNKTGDTLSPVTREKLNRELIYPNHLVKKLYEQRDFEDLKCPIGCDYFREPVVAADGHTYESDSVTNWFGDQTTVRSPLTNLPLNRRDLIRNRCVEETFVYIPFFRNFEESMDRIYQEHQRAWEKLGFEYQLARKLQELLRELERREALWREAVVEDEIAQAPNPQYRRGHMDYWPRTLSRSAGNVLERYDLLTGARTAEYARRHGLHVDLRNAWVSYESRAARLDSLLSQIPVREVVIGGVRFSQRDVGELMLMISDDLAANNEPFVSELHPHTFMLSLEGLRATGRPVILESDIAGSIRIARRIEDPITMEEFDSPPGGFPIRLPRHGGRVKYQKYRLGRIEYKSWIEYDSNGRVLAGDWYPTRNGNPDLAWVPTARGDLSRRENWPNTSINISGLNPQVVWEIYRQSI